MTDCLIFNHHSLPFDQRDQAAQAIPDFLKICIEAKNAGMSTILVDEAMDKSWFRVELAQGHFWKDWYDQHKSGEARDAVRAFRSIATQSPFFNSDDIQDGVELFDVSLNGDSSFSAVRSAAWHDSPLVSFETRAPWDGSPLRASVSRMDPLTEQISEVNEELINFHNLSVLTSLLPVILEERRSRLQSAREVLLRFEEFYPKVKLCGKAESQLNRWSASSTILEQIKQALQFLNQFAVAWGIGDVSHYSADILRDRGLPFQVSGESATVRSNPALRKEREFWIPAGVKEYFEHHIKMSDGYRLHFFPDSETKNVYVGYIGPHLRLK